MIWAAIALCVTPDILMRIDFKKRRNHFSFLFREEESKVKLKNEGTKSLAEEMENERLQGAFSHSYLIEIAKSINAMLVFYNN